MRQRKFTDEEAIRAIKNKNNITVAMVLKEIGALPISGGDYYLIKKIVKKYNLNTSHWLGRSFGSMVLGKQRPNWRPIEFWLVDDCPSKINSHTLKNKLFKRGVKERKCEKCGIEIWQGQNAPLQLDHVNGIKTDNRLENLRILCPNCHAQTSTYCSKNRKLFVERDVVGREDIVNAVKCSYNIHQTLKRVGLSCAANHYMKVKKIMDDEKISFLKKEPKFKSADLFWRTKPKLVYRRVERPPKEELIILIKTKPMVQIAKQFGLTDNSIRKWCELYGIDWKSMSPFSHESKRRNRKSG